MTTENRDYNVPEPGEEDWHVPVNENWEKIDADMQAALDAAQAALEAADGDDGGDGDATSEPTSGGGGTGFTWDQTHSDTSWLFDADANDDLNVEVVTSLDIDGSGSITEAVESGGSAPTLVVFEVGGVIDIGGGPYWYLTQDNTYIAGQTAPWPGITFIRGGPRISAGNVIMQHISVVTGDDVNDANASRALTVEQGENDVIFDHCTAAQAADTNVNLRGEASRRSFINGIISEPLNNSSHPEAPHGYSLLFRDGEELATAMGNLILSGWKRNPRPNDASFAYLNNYVYNWGDRIYHGPDPGVEGDMVANVIEAGPDTDLSAGIFDGDPGVIYFDDNTIIPADTPLNDGDIDYVNNPMNMPIAQSDLVPPAELEDFLAPMIGPRPADRAPYEQRVIDEWRSRSSRIIDHHGDVGGYPDYDPQERSLDPPSSGLLDWLQQYTNEVQGTSA